MKKGNLFACCKVACNEKITMLFMQHFIKKKLYFCPVLASEQGLVNANAFVSWDLFVKLWGTWLFRHMLGNFPIMSHVFFSCYLWLWYVDLKAPLNKCVAGDGEAKAAGDEQLSQGRDPEYSTAMKKIHTDVETGQSISPARNEVMVGSRLKLLPCSACPGLSPSLPPHPTQGADDVQTQPHISYREQKQGQNHSVIKSGKDLQDHPVQQPTSNVVGPHSPSNHVLKCHIHTVSVPFQGW